MAEKKKNFDRSMERLSEIVTALEDGKISLDESLALFEEGVGLVKACNQKLDEAENRIRILTRDENGEVVQADFSTGEVIE